MKILVIGGSQGIGKAVVEYFNGTNVSKSLGYNINKDDDRKRILEMSLEHNAVLNHAYSGNNSQSTMLIELIEYWKENNKDGYIFNTGTVNTYFSNNRWDLYPIYKMQQDEICKRAAKKFQENAYPFRITNIRPGMLDTEKSRQKPHWPGSGVTGDTYCNIIQYLYNLPKEVIIPEIVLETKVP